MRFVAHVVMGSAVRIWRDRTEEGARDEEERIDPPRDGDCVGTSSREAIGNSGVVHL